MVGDSGHAFKIVSHLGSPWRSRQTADTSSQPVGDLSSFWTGRDDKRASKSRTD